MPKHMQKKALEKYLYGNNFLNDPVANAKFKLKVLRIGLF
jgi:hypothetical protein